MAEETKEFKDLVRQRGSVRSRLTNFCNYLALLKEVKIDKISDTQIKELSVRVDKVESLFLEFEKYQNQIELLCSVLDEQLKERDVTEKQYYTSMGEAQSLIELYLTNKNQDNKGSNSNSGDNLNVKLPIIKLPTFDGNYFLWLEYRDTFESIIHNNDSVPDINKFHYLRSSLEGSAALVIKSIEFTSQNYKIAWELLCQRYDNKKILINNHLKALFKIESIAKESHRSLRYLIDVVTKNLRALTTLGQPVDQWDTLIIYMVSTKLDSVSSNKWEEHKNTLSDLPSLNEFLEFLRNRADVLETTQANRSEKTDYKFGFHNNNNHNNKSDQKYVHNNNQIKFTKSFVTSARHKFSGALSCPRCNQSHRIVDCESFKSLSLENKLSEVLKLNLCSNCLRRGHDASTCRLGTCRLCNEKHNTLLHKKENNCNNNLKNKTENNNPPVSMSVRSTGQVLLGTALVKVTNPENKNTYHARALLDAGSQSSFMTEKLKRKLGTINRDSDSIIISGINNVHVPITDRCDITVRSLTSAFSTNLKCLVVPEITGQLPNVTVNVSNLNLPDVDLADPNFFDPSDIDMLLGADIFYDILLTGKFRLGPNMPVLQSTKLGWIVAGPLGIVDKVPTNVHCNFTREIHDNLTKFWNLEEIPSTKLLMSAEDEFCEEHFLKNTYRTNDGRFSVLMPLKEPETALGNSYNMASKRFFNLEKKLDKNPELQKQYHDFIAEYEALGHMSKIKKPDFGYYMPHHAVIRENSETTKLRTVFDASMKTTSRKSLNDIQYTGPVVQDDLFSILLRFRQHKYVLTGDIQKMYRQVLINEPQRKLQLILWRYDKSQPLETYQLNTITYGTASAPYLSTRCLLQLGLEHPDQLISEIIKHDFYMDDWLTGADSEADLAYILKHVTEVLNSACFPLHKFRTNCPQIFQESTLPESLNLGKESSVLGVQWAPDTDTLKFSINIEKNLDKITKRNILSNTCKIFDPLGLLSPCTVTLKMLLQKLWQIKLEWDEEVPTDINKIWKKMINDLDVLISVSVPRHVLCLDPTVCELHCFVDASKDAYAACVYMRTVDQSNHVTVQLLCAKTRVAPLKTVTIPRLELCAAVLGARLVQKVAEALRCTIHKKVFWSDSTITLGWIRTPTKNLKTFVCNRVIEINDLTERNSWRHVPTNLNPADIASRGEDPKRVVDCTLWWEGPDYLKNDESKWPVIPNSKLILPELKVLTVNTKPENKKSELIKFENYSNSSKLKRIFAYVLRFINNCKKENTKSIGSLKHNELEQSLNYLIQIAQLESFKDEINLLKKGKSLTSSNFSQLSPFLDDSGVVRVGGRLDNTNFDFNKKHPMLLDGKHHFTKLLMKAEHLRLLHAGPQLLLASFREQFWPLGGRTLSRKITRQCVICTRFRGKTMEPLMGHLPASRVTRNYPFQLCGIDYAGPFLISTKKGRGNRITKCYMCLFVCFCTKAVHLEIVSDLSTNAFISCLRRFISRRGKPSQIFCDNATNFVGANNELGRALQSSMKSVYEFTAEEGIKFNFNPPYSPTFGGLWEAGIKSAKSHMKRIVGNASLTFEELGTLCTQIEAVLNSRPLTPLSPDSHDLSPLTPGHFLIGRPLTSLPSPPAATERKIKTRYQLIEALRENFWKRWHNEYLSELQKKTKWRYPKGQMREGMMVVFKENNLPPMKWKLGRVHRLFPGKDGVARVADFVTYRGIERRALNKVCPLLLEEDDLEAAASSATSKGPQDVCASRGAVRGAGRADAAGKRDRPARARHCSKTRRRR